MGPQDGCGVPSRRPHPPALSHRRTLQRRALEVGEERISFTQFTAGGLFRWVDNGGCTAEELQREDPDEWERMQALKESRWETGLSYFSTVDELLDPESSF
jgi:hypothetical protein